MQNYAALYEQDFYAWTQVQAKLIQEKLFDNLDLTHLFEEVESMGISQRNELDSRLSLLLMHLLKWKYQASRQCKSWIRTMKIQRFDVKKLLKRNPSLTNQNTITEALNDAYYHAVLNAADETNLDEDCFPKQCEWTIKQILDEEFLPN